MSVKSKIFVFLLAVMLMTTVSLPAFAGDRDVSARDLQGIPKHHRFLVSLLGGAALGAGVGAILPGGRNNYAKGALIGGGLTGLFYMNTHRNAAGAWEDWAHIGAGTALGNGIGWSSWNFNGGA